jgi:polar amino acid transport system permease protein
MRGALGSVPRGQIEAAMALGLSRHATNRRVIWPQAALVAIRPMGNELITLIKSSALAAIVTLLDLMGQTRFIFSRTFDFSVYLYCAVLYLILTEAVRRTLGWVERRFSLHLRAANPMLQSGTSRPVPARASTRRPTPA